MDGNEEDEEVVATSWRVLAVKHWRPPEPGHWTRGNSEPLRYSCVNGRALGELFRVDGWWMVAVARVCGEDEAWILLGSWALSRLPPP